MADWLTNVSRGIAVLSLTATLSCQEEDKHYVPSRVGEYSPVRVLTKGLRINQNKTPREAFDELSNDGFLMEATEASNFELYFAHADSNLAPYLSEQNNHGNTVTTNTSDFSIPTIDGLAEDFYKLLKPAAEDQRELYGERVLNQDLRHVDIDAIVYQPNSDGVGGTVYAINNPNR